MCHSLSCWNQTLPERDMKRALLVVEVFGPCIGARLACAFVYVAMIHFSLPPSDFAYGSSLWQLLRDPFVRLGATTGGVFSGVISFPFTILQSGTATLHISRVYIRNGCLRDFSGHTVCRSTRRTHWFSSSTDSRALRCGFLGGTCSAKKLVTALI